MKSMELYKNPDRFKQDNISRKDLKGYWLRKIKKESKIWHNMQ